MGSLIASAIYREKQDDYTALKCKGHAQVTETIVTFCSAPLVFPLKRRAVCCSFATNPKLIYSTQRIPSLTGISKADQSHWPHQQMDNRIAQTLRYLVTLNTSNEIMML